MLEKIEREGVMLAYEESAGPDPPLIFVHGWTCDHTHFAPQVEHFGRRHRIVAVDLRGHGESDKPEQTYTMEGFADDVAWLCRQLQLNKPVIVGHSMGGVVALALASRHPDLPAAIVAVDSPWVPAQNVRDLVPGLTAAFRGPEFREVLRQVVANAFFLPTDDQRRKEKIVQHMSSAPQHVMASAWEQVWDFDSARALAELGAPALYIGSSAPFGPDGASAPLGSPEGIRAANPRIIIGQTVGAGHWNQFDAADQVTAMIDRFLATSLLTAPSS